MFGRGMETPLDGQILTINDEHPCHSPTIYRVTTKRLTLRSVNIFYNAHASAILRLVLESQDIRNYSTKRIGITNVIVLSPILILQVLSGSNKTHFLATYYRIP